MSYTNKPNPASLIDYLTSLSCGDTIKVNGREEELTIVDIYREEQDNGNRSGNITLEDTDNSSWEIDYAENRDNNKDQVNKENVTVEFPKGSVEELESLSPVGNTILSTATAEDNGYYKEEETGETFRNRQFVPHISFANDCDGHQIDTDCPACGNSDSVIETAGERILCMECGAWVFRERWDNFSDEALTSESP